MTDLAPLPPAIILVEPQMGENIGAAARVMLNFGLKDLRIVNPRDGWPNPKAIDMAKGAISVLESAKIYNCITNAIDDIHYVYATTARPREMVKPVISARKCGEDMFLAFKSAQQSALLFGRERSGLTNDEISYADAITIIPVFHEYTSLNIAQAVSILSYEWFVAQDSSPDYEVDFGNAAPAPKADIVRFFEHLEFELDNNGFFKTNTIRPKMVRNIRNMFVRAALTDQDVRTLRGIISSLSQKSAKDV